jgi:hypothetical protein
MGHFEHVIFDCAISADLLDDFSLDDKLLKYEVALEVNFTNA